MNLDDQVLDRRSTRASGADVRSIFSQLKPSVVETRHIALVGTYTPRKCGSATFGTDVFEKLAQFHPNIRVDIYALDDPKAPLSYEGIAGTIAFGTMNDVSRMGASGPGGGAATVSSRRRRCATGPAGGRAVSPCSA